MARKGFTREEAVQLRTLISVRVANHVIIPTNMNGGFVLQLLDANEMGNLRLDPSRRICSIVTNSEGELLDGWATPYRIEFIDRSTFVIRSAGKNRVFGDRDDIRVLGD